MRPGWRRWTKPTSSNSRAGAGAADRRHLRLSGAADHALRHALLPGAATLFDGAFQPVLEASTTAGWRKVADLPLYLVPASAGFAPVTAAHFRVVITRSAGRQSGLHAGAGRRPGLRSPRWARPKGLRLSQLVLSAEPKVNQFEAKAGFATVDDYYALDAGVDPDEKRAWPPAPSST
jgi:hypothetical protein